MATTQEGTSAGGGMSYIDVAVDSKLQSEARADTSVGRDVILESGRVIFAPNPMTNLAAEILQMQGTPENGGRIDFAPNRIANYLNGKSQTNAGFKLDLGGFSGTTGISTLAIVAGAAALGFFIILRRRR